MLGGLYKLNGKVQRIKVLPNVLILVFRSIRYDCFIEQFTTAATFPRFK